MPVTGTISKRTYNEGQIFDSTAYPKMKSEPLCNEDGALVVPVRNKKRPHFRRIGDATFRKRLGSTEVDPTHKKVVKWLKKSLPVNRLRVITWVFDDDDSSDSPSYEEQVIFLCSDKTHYKWFSENECRIAFEGGDYIIPDIAGRDTEAFSPAVGHESVIIEVIQTHYPDQDTFFRLLSLSSIGYLVIFYFVAPDKWDSKFNRCTIDEGLISINPAYYLAQGQVFKNGKPRPQHETENDAHWYSYLENTYFKHAMENK